MHAISTSGRFRLVTALLATALAMACAAPQRPQHGASVPAAASAAGDDVAAPAPPAAPAPASPTEEPVPRPAAVDAPEPVAEDPEDDEAFPGEEVSASPLDELAEVAPQLDDSRLEAERQRAESAVPAFDIPVVTNDAVLFWLDHYATRTAGQFEPGLRRSGRYMHLFRRIFEEEGLPLDLIYMAHVESAYKTTAYSKAHARGIFQFIAATGRRYGLRIDYWVDERLDPEASARASAAYLKDLYAEFGDWYLALAAYNAGEGRIRQALRRSGGDDFWGIAATRHIRRETKNYVPAILAAVMISKEPEKYGFYVEPDPPVLYETVDIDGAVDLQVLARCAGTDLATLKRLNPALRRHQTPPHARTPVRVPPGTGAATRAALAEVPDDQRVLYVRHPVGHGDTLYALARRYGVSVSAIQQANRMGRRTMIRVGQVLTIPTVGAGAHDGARAEAASGHRAAGESVVYRVRRGDTLSGIARRHGTTPGAIAAANGIPLGKVLQIGERLTVPGIATAAAATFTAVGGEPRVHTVRQGESLWLIARLYETTIDQLCRWNRISPRATLYPGTRLTIGN